MNYGLHIDEIKEEDFIFGGQKLGDAPILEDGQWDGWIPVQDEIQNLNGIEPYACASFGTLNCVETLERQEFNVTENYSDRFLATATGTGEKKGNSPKTVAQFLKDKGCVLEKEYPFDGTVDSFDKFYKTLPQQLYTLALQFPAQYDFGYERVPSDYDSLMGALKYSPLGFSVYAWVQEDGIYYRPQGMTDNHWVCCYGYERNKWWKIYDSYDSTHKKVRWDSLPMQCLRYTLHRNVVNETAWDKFISLLKKICGIS